LAAAAAMGQNQFNFDAFLPMGLRGGSIQFRPAAANMANSIQFCSVLAYGVNSISAYKAAIGRKYIKIELNCRPKIHQN